jgi:hypothetical protein
MMHQRRLRASPASCLAGVGVPTRTGERPHDPGTGACAAARAGYRAVVAASIRVRPRSADDQAWIEGHGIAGAERRPWRTASRAMRPRGPVSSPVTATAVQPTRSAGPSVPSSSRWMRWSSSAASGRRSRRAPVLPAAWGSHRGHPAGRRRRGTPAEALDPADRGIRDPDSGRDRPRPATPLKGPNERACVVPSR